MQWCHNMMMPLGAKYKTYSSREFLFISFINSGHFSIHWELKASVYFTLLSMSHVALCCWIRETRGRNSQTDTRLSRLNKHAENKNLIWPKKSIWKWHRRNPIFPFLTGPKGGLGERDKTVHAISGWRGKVWVCGGVGGGVGRGGVTFFFFFILKVICLLLACPCGVFYLGLGW